LESDGLRGFNTNAIAAKAGVSIGSLYQYFPNKDSIVLALIGSFEKAFHDTVVKAVQDGKGKRTEIPPQVGRSSACERTLLPPSAKSCAGE
jgi:AcrR family transcriptional regulator